MPKGVYGGLEFEIDDDGFIQEPEKWNEAVACDLAKTDGIDIMTEDHWKVANYIRQYWLEFNLAPPFKMICKRTGLGERDIWRLFPGGPARGACKVAGLPRPTGCIM